MARTYAVIWRIGQGPIYVGKLELGAAVTLEGGDETGQRASAVIARDKIKAIKVARNSARLRGRRTLIFVRSGGSPFAVASLEGAGTALELFEHLEA